MPLMGGSGGSGSSDLAVLANLAAVFSDPEKLQKQIADLQARKEAAEQAEAKARDASIKLDERIKALAITEASLNERIAKQAEDEKNLSVRAARQGGYSADLTAREDALKKAQATFDAAQALAKSEADAVAKAFDTRTANANAALDKRAAALKTGEDALLLAQRKLDEARTTLDARAARIAQAVA